MRERGDSARLALEPGERLGARGEFDRQHFDRDVAVQPGVVRAIDFPHAARTEDGHDLVLTETDAGQQRHGAPRLSHAPRPLDGRLARLLHLTPLSYETPMSI